MPSIAMNVASSTPIKYSQVISAKLLPFPNNQTAIPVLESAFFDPYLANP
jgi:hypothetical protein